jgi:hypothetical protein
LCLLGILLIILLWFQGIFFVLKIIFVLTFFNLWKKNIVHQLGSGKRTSNSFVVSIPYVCHTNFPPKKISQTNSAMIVKNRSVSS